MAASASRVDSPPTHSSGYLLARVGAQSRRRWARMLTEHGPSPSHFGLLRALGQLGTTSLRRDGEDLERQMLACLDPDEQAALHQLLLKLYHAMRHND
jgi:hypothetical protein